MRGMKRLSNLNQSLMKTLDDKADALADELEAAGKEAMDGLSRAADHVAEVKKNTAEFLADLGLMTNSPPSQGSETSEPLPQQSASSENPS